MTQMVSWNTKPRDLKSVKGVLELIPLIPDATEDIIFLP